MSYGVGVSHGTGKGLSGVRKEQKRIIISEVNYVEVVVSGGSLEESGSRGRVRPTLVSLELFDHLVGGIKIVLGSLPLTISFHYHS